MTIKWFAIPTLMASVAFCAERSQEKTIKSIGMYLDQAEYDASAFALIEQAEDAMQGTFPGIPWQTIDSSDRKAAALPFPLSRLGDLTQAHPDSQALRMGRATCAAYGCSHLLLIHREVAGSARDSSPEFGSASTFALVDAETGKVVLKHAQRNKGQRGAKSSAETAWARNAWDAFAKAWKTRPGMP